MNTVAGWEDEEEGGGKGEREKEDASYVPVLDENILNCLFD